MATKRICNTLITGIVLAMRFVFNAYADPPAGTRGDVNGDNTVNIVDALLIAQYYVGLNPQNFNINNADTNCDGSIDIVDALLIAQYNVGLITNFC